MDTRILLALSTMAVIICLQFTTASSLPTAAEEPGALETDGNQTDWTFSPLEPLREQHHMPGTPCKSYSRAQLVRKLNRLGNKPGASSYGGFNRRFMAITEKEAENFPSLITTVKGASPLNFSSTPLRVPTQVGTLTSRANCRQVTNGGLLRMCSVCPARTFLGPDKIPSYINEVTCGQTECSSGLKPGVFGLCQSTVMLQQFLYKTGKCNSRGYDELKPYTQRIRVCCECMLVPI